MIFQRINRETMSKEIKVTMPFINNNPKDTEVEIISENIMYSEIEDLSGIQVSDESIKDEALTLCKEISKNIKLLNTLINE